MIKNKMAKLVGTAMAATLMLSVAAPVVASANEKEVAPQTAQTQDDTELNYAIEEIRVAGDYLDNKDLSNRDNREYALAFANAAVERVRGMENEGNVLFINETADQLRKAIDIADRLSFEMQSITDAFEDGRDKEYKETVLGYLNGTLSEIVHSDLKNDINDTTLNAVNEFLHTYANKLAQEINGEETQTTEQTQNDTELNYAIEEIRVAGDYLDNKDLSNRDNREYALAFATAAVERVRGMENEGHVAFINETADQLRKAIDIADRLSFEMQSITDAFEDGRDKEYKETVLGYLNGTLSEIVHSDLKNDINDTTLNAANEFLHTYADKLAQEL
ncbi:MAG: hypothetical protein RR744_05610 [Cellulosilyticaceae bacterium]